MVRMTEFDYISKVEIVKQVQAQSNIRTILSIKETPREMVVTGLTNDNVKTSTIIKI